MWQSQHALVDLLQTLDYAKPLVASCAKSISGTAKRSFAVRFPTYLLTLLVRDPAPPEIDPREVDPTLDAADQTRSRPAAHGGEDETVEEISLCMHVAERRGVEELDGRPLSWKYPTFCQNKIACSEVSGEIRDLEPGSSGGADPSTTATDTMSGVVNRSCNHGPVISATFRAISSSWWTKTPGQSRTLLAAS
eukprot:2130901-Rhodomonas_salina.1